MWALDCIAHLWIHFCFSFTVPHRQGEACNDKTVSGKTPRSVTVVTFEFFENIRHHHLDPKFSGNGDFRKSKTIV